MAWLNLQKGIWGDYTDMRLLEYILLGQDALNCEQPGNQTLTDGKENDEVGQCYQMCDLE